ncbi:sulfurtransferase [Streptomyces sp. NPDC050560]|uniref:sulfurtransferase n=1 Tax=Streptomyces sp. NPDC050560 TaxID=3365630 RepID=UPI0037A9AEEC
MSTAPDATRVTVDADELARLLSGDERPVLLDVRHDPRQDGAGHAAFAEGHIPGALYVDLARDLARPGRPDEGRHPLPALDTLQATVRRWGVSHGTPVVVYDARSGLSAGRAWWVLRWAGLENVRILDGGIAAWTARGHRLTDRQSPLPAPGDAVLTTGALPVVDADTAAAYAARGLLFDARGIDAYERGHIPGAHSTPAAANLRVDGTLSDPAALRARYAALLPRADGEAPGPTPFAVYCGSGVSAAFQTAVLTALGIPVALYPGSWSAWSADPARPVATGPDPGPGRAAVDHENGG